MTQTDIVPRVVKTVAAADGIDTEDLDSLYEYIDPEVLLKLDNQEMGEWSFTFQYSDHQVTITHDTKIFVDGMLQTQNASMKWDTVDNDE